MKNKILVIISFGLLSSILPVFLWPGSSYGRVQSNNLTLSITSLSSSATISWTLSYDSPSYQIKTLAVYDNKLYAGGFELNQTDGRLYRYDGIAWVDTNFASNIGVTVDMIEALHVFNNRLYIGTRVDVGGNKFARIYYYDGTIFTQDFSANGQPGVSGIEDFVIHNNILYAANNSQGEVYQRNGDNNWVILGSTVDSGNPVLTLASYNGSLFAGTSTQAKVWRWTGTTWVLMKNLTSDFSLTQTGVQSLASVNGFLYAGLNGPGVTAPIFVYNGANWTISTTIDNCNFARLVGIDTKVWAGTCGGQVFALEDSIWKAKAAVEDDGASDFVNYNQYIYTGTFGNGRIYYLKYFTFLPIIYSAN